LSRFGQMISAAKGLLRKDSMPAHDLRSEYMRDGRGLTFSGWHPPALREPYDDVARAWAPASARTTDLMHNVGWIAGGIEQATVDCVGNGLKLNAKPNAAALRLDPVRAAEWAKLCEARFAVYANRAWDCDVEGRRHFGQMQAAQYKSWFGFGEMVAELPWRPRVGSRYGTKVRLVAPHRLSQRTDIGNRLIQGVRMDPDGLPVSYLFAPNNRLSNLMSAPAAPIGEVEVAARDAMGRPKIIHNFDGAISTTRGISVMVPVLKVARQFDQLANATLMQNIVRSLFAFSIESDQPTDDVLSALLTPEEQAAAATQGMSAMEAWFASQAGWYDKKNIDVGITGRGAQLYPGQHLEFHTSQGPSADYREFAKDLLRENARCIGITYEGFTGDYAGVTFSSMKVATDYNWRVICYRRKNIVSPFCQGVYEGWLEEEIEQGGPLALPGGIDQFHENRAEICNADWTGSPKPTPDELKAANERLLRLRMGAASQQMVCEEYGVDYEDVCAEKAAARTIREKYGLPDEDLTNAGVAADPNVDPETGDPKKDNPPSPAKDKQPEPA